MNITPTDHKKLLQAEQGDKKSLGELLENYRELLYKLAYNNIGIKNQSDDIVGDTIIQSLSQFDQKPKTQNFINWLLNNFYQVCASYIDVDAKVVHLESEQFQEMLTEGIIPEEVDVHFQKMTEKQQIWNSLEALSEKSRAVILLYYFADITAIDNLSEMLDLPQTEIRKILNDSRNILSKTLKIPPKN